MKVFCKSKLSIIVITGSIIAMGIISLTIHNYYPSLANSFSSLIKVDKAQDIGLNNAIIDDDYLKIERDEVVTNIDEREIKLSFSSNNIDKNTISCTTSEDIASCNINENNIILIPKKIGKTTVIISAKSKDKTYISKSNVTIKDVKRYIELNSTSATLDLTYASAYYMRYKLVNLEGEITATSSDESVASIVPSDNLIRVTGHKNGKVTITLSIQYDGKLYSKKFDLTIFRSKREIAENRTEETDQNIVPNETVEDNIALNPTPVDGGEESIEVPVKKDSDSLLRRLEVSSGTLSPKFKSDTYEYDLNLHGDTLSLTARTNSFRATIYYLYNDIKYTAFKTIPINFGDSTIKIVVTAESEDKTEYKINVHKNIDKIILEKVTYTCYIDDETCKIPYQITKNGLINEEYDEDEITLLNSKQAQTSLIGREEDRGYIIASLDKDKIGTKETYTLCYKEACASFEIQFKTHKISRDKKTYDFSIDSENNKMILTVETNLFADEIISTVYENGKTRICSKDDDGVYLDIYADSKIIDNIEFKSISLDNKTISFEISAIDTGETKIYLDAFIDDINVDNLELTFVIKREYIIKIDTNGGRYKDSNTEKIIKVSEEKSIDLSNIEKPLKYTSDDNYYYSFKGYSIKESDEIIYNGDEIISSISSDIELVAQYDNELHSISN